MSMNLSFSFGYLALTNVYNHNAESNESVRPVAITISKSFKIKIFPRWYKQITLQWEVPSTWGRCLFNVYYCPSEAGPYERINASPIDGNYIKDTGNRDYLKFNQGHYILEAILLDKGSQIVRSESVTWDPPQNRKVELMSIEIQRREYVLLSKFAGIKSYIFSAKNYGERCPECWSHTAEKAVKDHCPTCFGTTFKGGYFGPVETFMQYDATPNQNVRTYFGTFEPDQIGAWTISYPEIRPDDIIVRSGNWSVYRVDALTSTELQGVPVRQITKLTQLAKSNIEHQLVTRIDDFPKEFIE